MPEMDGIETLRRLKTVAPDLPVVMITVDTDLAAAVEATKLGAYDFLLRPVDEERLLLTIRHALERSSLRDQVENLRHIVGQGGYLSKLVLPSSSMRAIVEQIANAVAVFSRDSNDVLDAEAAKIFRGCGHGFHVDFVDDEKNALAAAQQQAGEVEIR